MVNKKQMLSFIVWLCCFSLYAQEQIEIINFDIGQGDATLIVSTISSNPFITERDSIITESDSIITVLFDAGGYTRMSGEDAGIIINNYLVEKKIRRIDYLIISHYDADHIGATVAGGHQGMYEVSFVLGEDGKRGTDDDVEVVNVIDRGNEKPPTTTIFQKYVDFTKTVNRVSITSRHDLGYEIYLGPEARMTCVAANGFVKGRDSRIPNTSTENEKSLSFHLSYKAFDYLISGDLTGRKSGGEDARIEEAVGEYLQSQDVNIDVLHVNHHGANNTSSTKFLSLIEAEIAVISCGDGNRHHHPTLGNLGRLKIAGVQKIFQTNEGTTVGTIPDEIIELREIFNGHVVIWTDGNAFDIYKYGYAYHKGGFFGFICDE